MDLVVVTYAPDVKLLRHALASYELYYEDKDRFLVFTSRDDRYLFEQIDLPARCELIYREDIAELRDTTPYSHQTFLKLWAHNVVTTERYLIIDSDFLLVKPTRDRDFYRGDRPIWFYRPWVEGEPPLRWKAGTEKFVGESIDLCYGDIPQWVYDRSIARDLCETLDATRILNDDSVWEPLVYGWFARREYPDAYDFVPQDAGVQPIVEKVNQVPPTYLRLDPDCRYEQYQQPHCVVFWSYWELAEAKMREFFEDSQVHHFGRVVRPTDPRKLVVRADLARLNAGDYGGIDGVYSDGWLKAESQLAVSLPSGARGVNIDVMVPGQPSGEEWSLPITVSTETGAEQRWNLSPGSHRLQVGPLVPGPQGTCALSIRLGPGFTNPSSPDAREFRAHLQSITPSSAVVE